MFCCFLFAALLRSSWAALELYKNVLQIQPHDLDLQANWTPEAQCEKRSTI